MKPNQKVTVSVSNRTVAKVILWVIATIIAFRLAGRLSHELTIIFVSFFLALALNPVVSWMSRHLKIKSRVRAAAVGYLTVIAVIAVFLALVVPPLVRQTRDFINTVPSTVSNFQKQDTGVARLARKYNIDQKLSQTANDFTSHYSNFGGTLLNTGKRIVGAVVTVLAVLVLTFMMLVEGPRWMELLWGIFPDRNRAHHRKLAHQMYKAVSGFVNGQVVLALVAGTFAFVALEIASNIMNVSINPAALAGIVAMFGIIPLFGNPISSAIVVLICLLNSVALAVVMLVYFLVYYQIENLSLQPFIQSRLNALTPMLVFIAAILGIGIDGFLGAIVAIPVASAIKILLEDYFENHRSKGNAPTESLSL